MAYFIFGFTSFILFLLLPFWAFVVVTCILAAALFGSRLMHRNLKTPVNKFRFRL